MKDGAKFVTGQQVMSRKMLQDSVIPNEMLAYLMHRANEKMEEAMRSEGLVIKPGDDAMVRVVVECIAVPK